MNDGFEHRLTDAATAAPVKTTGVNSAFALGQGHTGTVVVKAKGLRRGKSTTSGSTVKGPSVREGSMRERCLKTIEACGQLTNDKLSEALEITVKQATDLANQLVTLGFLVKRDVDGRKAYELAKREGGFYRWLDRKAQQASATDSAPLRRKPGRRPSEKTQSPNSLEATPENKMRCAIYNDGALLIEANGEKFELCYAHALELKQFLEGTA